jgi:hypothetical protein
VNLDLSLGTVLGVATFAGGLIAWYRARVEKSYAAQRDFGHVKESIKSLTTNLNSLKDWEDARFDAINATLSDIKSMLYGVYGARDKVPGPDRNDRSQQ